MNTPEKCPKCGANNGGDGWEFVYDCGSYFDDQESFNENKGECVLRQRDQLAAELEAIRAASAALVERVHAAEAVLTSPHALWSNWLRGTVKLPAGIGDIRECSEKMKRFRSRWLAAHQELRKAEGKIERAEERVKRLEEAADTMANAYNEILWDRHDAGILEEYRKVRGEK